MAGLRIFISSTCFDLKAYRSQLQSLLLGMGHEPVLSENGDVLYDPGQHTHTSCVTEIPNADILVLLIGARYGGAAIPEALNEIDFAKLEDLKVVTEKSLADLSLSVTQAEVLKAVESGVPIFAFVDSGVHADLFVYNTNKKNGIHRKIEYPNIDKQETASYIFEFIELLRRRANNNAIFPYVNFGDIEANLTRQLSFLFQRLLRNERDKKDEKDRDRQLLTEIRDVKAAMIQSIDKKSARDVAKSVLKYRRVLDFLGQLRSHQPDIALEDETANFYDLLLKFGVDEIKFEQFERGRPPQTVLIFSDDLFLLVRASPHLFNKFSLEWDEFSKLDPKVKAAVVDSLSDVESRSMLIRRFDESYHQYRWAKEHLDGEKRRAFDSPTSPAGESLNDIIARALLKKEDVDEDDDIESGDD